MVPKTLAIAENTFVETIRTPVFSVLIWIGGFWIAFMAPSLAGFTLESGGDAKMAIDVGLATLLLYGLLASVFSATSVITREIEGHTVLTVVSKPVSRPTFLLGKYLGVCGAVFVGYYLLSIFCMLMVRHGTMPTAADKWDQPVLLFGVLGAAISVAAATFGNYFYGWHFPAALLAWAVPLETVALVLVLFISPEWELQPVTTDFGDMQLVYAIVMAFFGVLILTAFAVALSTRFSQVMTLMFCAGVYVVGLLSDYYLGQPATEGVAWFYTVLYAVTPNFQFFWTGDAITQELVIPAAQVARVALYSVLYSLGVLCLGVALFQTREVG
jgi:hypothetical protein